MCGILGQIKNDKIVDEERFLKSLELLRHRGPDGYDTKLLNNSRVVLGHRRLSIIDLSDLAKQPMTNENEDVWLTFNGEIYNHLQLRNQLIEFGHRFISQSDSEVLIHGYEQWGIQGLLSKIRGMFSFGIWDQRSNKLTLARDRFGIKPMYYSHDENGMCFGSEIKALLPLLETKPSLNFGSIADFFVYRFTPSTNTIWKEIQKLPPGNYLEFEYGKIQKHKYWDFNIGDSSISENDLINEFEHLFQESVKEHLVSDVEIGVFLSGGYDSTSIVSELNKIGQNLSTYSIGFKNWERSEDGLARQVSQHFGTDHHEKIISGENLLESFDKLMYYYDEPIGGTSFLPTYEVSRLASNDVKVVLSGDGGDELLAGYNWHYKIISELNSSWRSRFSFKRGKSQLVLSKYFNQMSWAGYSYTDVNKLFGGNIFQNQSPSELSVYEDVLGYTNDPVKQLQLLDYKYFMPEVILPKVDRASMACSLEARVPFLDHRLTELLMSTSTKRYFKPPIKKYPLYKMIAKSVPDSVLKAPKRGFGAPLYFEEASSTILRVLSESILVEKKLIDIEVLNSKIKNRDLRGLWPVFVLDSWMRKWNKYL